MMLLYVAAGGAVGASGRYLMVGAVARWLGNAFPYGTLAVNVAGSLLMGLLIGILARSLPVSEEIRALLAVGVLGGFTTFSSFSLDVVSLLENGEYASAGIYIAASVLLSVAALILGLWCVRVLA